MKNKPKLDPRLVGLKTRDITHEFILNNLTVDELDKLHTPEYIKDWVGGDENLISMTFREDSHVDFLIESLQGTIDILRSGYQDSIIKYYSDSDTHHPVDFIIHPHTYENIEVSKTDKLDKIRKCWKKNIREHNKLIPDYNLYLSLKERFENEK